jgi:cyclophilin family peptidyl-prolyl cis-trans isomerase
MVNPKVFFDIHIGKRPAGRIEFELFADICPKTSENFRSLCTGERGISPTSKKLMHYKGCCFHRIISGFMAQSGDFVHGNGQAGDSIYSGKFADENFTKTHDEAGLLSMANSGPNTNGCQFFITFRDTPHLDGRHVVFGKIICGMNILKMMEIVATDGNDCPRSPVIIADCGQVLANIDITSVKVAQSLSLPVAVSSAPLKESQSSKNKDSANHITSTSGDIGGGGGQDETKAEGEKELTEAEVEQQMAGMTDTEKRLFKLRLRINQGRKANKQESEREYKRLTDGRFDKRERDKEWAESAAEREEHMKAAGVKKSEAFLLETAEQSQRKQEQRDRKQDNKATFGWEAFTVEANYKAYSKRLAKLPSYAGAVQVEQGGKTLEGNPLMYGKLGRDVGQDGLNRLQQDMEQREKQRDTFSRRRATPSSVNIDSINDKNEHFNKKLKRAFDKYTVEIRQNLERGTAL